MGGPTLLAACCLLLEACAFFLIQYLASMRSVFCAANSLNVNVVHFIIIPLYCLVLQGRRTMRRPSQQVKLFTTRIRIRRPATNNLTPDPAFYLISRRDQGSRARSCIAIVPEQLLSRLMLRSLKGLAKLFWSLRNTYEQNLNSLFLTQYNH